MSKRSKLASGYERTLEADSIDTTAPSLRGMMISMIAISFDISINRLASYQMSTDIYALDMCGVCGCMYVVPRRLQHC